MKNNNAAIFQILVALMFAYDAYVYITPYLGLDEEKLIVNNGLLKKEVIFLKDVTTIDEKNKKLIILFNQGSSTKQLKILLSHLKKQDREQFIKDLKSKLEDGVCVKQKEIL
ncbi:PH domain-containing protein [Desulfosporosinus sp. OT]|uniref:PH domain-containing protein n=1 Tax=Desulfosporosinus sp. OT TaxID=913865 RepID=UPI001FA803BB|nr:PH domain-containing protein [Desulfosporosinus sp. OT]